METYSSSIKERTRTSESCRMYMDFDGNNLLPYIVVIL